MKALKTLLWLLLVGVAASAGWLAAGGVNFAADAPHARVTSTLIAWARDRSVHMRAADLAVPALGDPKQLAEGAGHYIAMCEGCHLAPGKTADEFVQGLYPAPPNLSQLKRSPAEQFWIIKHGIKGSAMPAWGLSHDDDKIWAMVAFLQQLPDMSAAQYEALAAPQHDAAQDSAEHEHEHEHEHE